MHQKQNVVDVDVNGFFDTLLFFLLYYLSDKQKIDSLILLTKLCE
jgi:hypothetical protein